MKEDNSNEQNIELEDIPSEKGYYSINDDNNINNSSNEESKQTVLNQKSQNISNSSISDDSSINEGDSFLNKIKGFSTSKIVYNIKDYIFVLSLLMSSVFNFNILYFPYIILGFILSYFLSKSSKYIYKYKKISEIFVSIYSIFLLIIKFIFIKGIEPFFLEKYKNILINLGIQALINTNSFFYLMTTFIGEIILLLISLISLCISICYKDNYINSLNVKKKKLKIKDFMNLIRKNLIISYIMILGLSIFNISIITLVYIFIMNILLFLFAKKSKLTPFLLKILGILIYFVLLLQMFLINLLNIYHFMDKLKFDDEANNEKKNYSKYSQFGINSMYNDKGFIDFLSYLFVALSIISLSFSNNNLTFKDIYKNTKYYGEIIIEENKIDENDLNNNIKESKFKKYLIKIFSTIRNYFTSTSFILIICRILAIIWIYIFRNFYSILIFIWIFYSFSFFNDKSKLSRIMCSILNLTILISLFFFHIGNIDGYFENPEALYFKIKPYHIGLSKFQYKKTFYFGTNLFYFLINLLIFSLYENEKLSQINPIIRDKDDKNNYIEMTEEKAKRNESLIEAIILEDIQIEDSEKKILKSKTFINEVKNKEKLIKEDPKNMQNIINENKEIKNNKLVREKTLKEGRQLRKAETFTNNQKLFLKKLNLYYVIVKAFLYHIDKISLVIMYFIAIYSINIIHSILVIIFMIQLLKPDLISKISNYLMMIIQLLYFSEFIIDILNHYFNDYFKEKENLLKLIMAYNTDLSSTSVELSLYVVVYCFYFKYQLSNNSFYIDIVDDSNLNLSNYIEIKSVESNHPKLKEYLFFIGEIIIKIYIFILISLFVLFDTYFEINILFEIKLILFFIIVFQFLISIQKSDKNISMILNNFFLIYSSINTILVYIYQIICLQYFNINKSNIFFTRYLPIIGFYEYNIDNIYLKFLPHFVCNFISVLYFWEMQRIIKSELKERRRVESISHLKTAINRRKSTIKKNQLNDEPKEEEKEKDKDKNKNKAKLPQEKYEDNEKKIKLLQLKYFFFSFILFLTKSYWLFMFIYIAIIFTKYQISILIMIYILIFFITFIFIFKKRTITLNNFMCKKNSSYFTRILRYNTIEKNMQIEQTTYYRSKSFKYLLCVSFLSFILIYTYGLFYLFQHHCDSILEEIDKCKSKNLIPYENKEGENKIDEIFIQSIAYIFGFYTNSKEENIFKAGWIHLLFSLLISLDAYVQKLEVFLNKKVKENRQEYQNLSHENIKLKPFTNPKLFLFFILTKYCQKIKEKKNNKNEKRIAENEDDILLENNKIEKKNNLILLINIITDKEKEEAKKREFKENFIQIFKNAHHNFYKLKEKSNRRQITKVIRKIYEEIIIFFLICTSINKMNIWSFIYMIISFILIKTEKSIMKYYKLFCFLLFSTLIQSIIFISNLQINIHPHPLEQILSKMNERFKIPWYSQLGINEKICYFFGLGLSHYDINLIWMELVEIIIVYIYLDYFSYSIYQEKKINISNKSENNILNYYSNIFIDNTKTQEAALNLLKDEYKENEECMKYNFGIEILDYKGFLLLLLREVFIKLDLDYKVEDLNKIILEKNNEKLENYLNIKLKDKENEENEENIENINNINNINNKKKKNKKKKNKNNKDINNIYNLFKNDEQNEQLKFFLKIKEFIFLSFHNIILIIIIFISMMISGIISIFFIIYSLYFLIKSKSIYLGSKYYYPKAIKKILFITILIDISLQILYQFPLFDIENVVTRKLPILGINKILIFTKVEIEPGRYIYTYNVLIDKLFLVIGKALVYFFLSLQILIYSTQSFQDYYLSYITTKKYSLGRRTLMNVFKFNNERIESMQNSINNRIDMSRRLNDLKKKIEIWSNKNKNYNKNNINAPKNIINNIDNENEQKVLGENSFEQNEKEEEGNINNINNIEENKIEYKKKHNDEEKVKNIIKDWILDRFLVNLQIKIHQNAWGYTNINENEKEFFKRDTIQGKTKLISEVEKKIEEFINNKELLDLSEFKESEIKEVLFIFNEKKDKKKKDDKKDDKKDENISKKEEKESFENIMKDKINDKKMTNLFKIINDIKIEHINQSKEKKGIIDLNKPKYKQFEKFFSSELFTKYLSISYLLKNIIKDSLKFLSNNFYWICYIIMIINHIMSSSLLSLFYPISIFCYAIFEFPRPKKFYWILCFIYTVFILVIKFMINIDVIREIETFKNIINICFRYKIGLKICNSTYDYFFFIFYDILVLFILLINNYLLVSKGMWINREQNIENIYQAMERVVISEIPKCDIRTFNKKYLNFNERMKKEERKDLLFCQITPVESYYHKFESKVEDSFIQFIKQLFNISIQRTKIIFNEEKNIEEEKIVNRQEEIIKFINSTKINKENGILNKSQEILNNNNDNLIEENEQQINKNENIIDDNKKYNEKERNYFERLFPKIRNEKPGDDYYIYYTISMIFIIVFIILFYTSMVQDKTFGSIELTTKQFSGEMVIFLLIHIIILVFDRVLYISQLNNPETEYILYDKETKLPISDEIFKKLIACKYPNINIKSFSIPPELTDKLKEKYDIIYIQHEGTNYNSVKKYILQILLVIFVHIFIFFYCPMKGNMNTYNNIYCPEENEQNQDDDEYLYSYDANLCNDFLNNYALIIFYVFYVIYFFSSGLQVKYGYYDIKRKSLLKSGKNSINGIIYKSIRAIPFLYEIKLGIDWTFTKTCLDFFQWNKFESIYDIIYCTFCAMNGKNQQLIGQKIGKFLKVSIGGVFSFFLVFVLIIPLMLFSSLNPTNKLNNVTGARLTIELGFFYKNKAVKNYTLFENTKPSKIENILKEEKDWSLYNYSESIKTKNFPKEQIQIIQFFEESDKNWDLTLPHINNLRDLIRNRKNISELEYIGIILDYSFDRPLPLETMEVSKRYVKTIYYFNNSTEKENHILDELSKNLDECQDVEVEFTDVFSPPIRCSVMAYPKRITDEIFFPNLNIKIGFAGCKIGKNINSTNKNDTEINFLESYFTAKLVTKQKDQPDKIGGIKFHVFSDKVSSTTSGKNILTLYVSFVLVIGTYIRNFFAGQPETVILTEMPNSEDIINLCEGIKVARYRFDFEQEEKLYYYLIEIMRSPDYLRGLTHSSIEQFKQRKKITDSKKIFNDIK